MTIKTYIALFLLSSSLVVHAQFESIFGTTSTSWNIFVQLPDVGETDSLVMVNDTVISTVTYKNMQVYSYINANERLQFREDIATGKVWYYDKWEDEEFLIMDLSMVVDDTFDIDIWEYNDKLIVDSVYMKDGRKHIRFDYLLDMHDNVQKLTFIEGVGPNVGFLYYKQSGNPIDTDALLCTYKDGLQEYQCTFFTDTSCIRSIASVDEYLLKKSTINIYPNPCGDRITLADVNGDMLDGTLMVYDQCGQMVFSEALPKGKIQYTCNQVTKLQPGIYFLKYLDKNGVVVNQKLIKN